MPARLQQTPASARDESRVSGPPRRIAPPATKQSRRPMLVGLPQQAWSTSRRPATRLLVAPCFCCRTGISSLPARDPLCAASASQPPLPGTHSTLERPTVSRSAQGRAGDRGAQDARANRRAGQDQIRSCTGPTADLWAHESVIYAVASAPGAAVLAAAATGSSLSHRAPTVSAMLASVPPPASARGATQASSRRPPRAL